MSPGDVGDKDRERPVQAFFAAFFPRGSAMSDVWTGSLGLWLLSLLGIIAALVNRALEPSLPGVWEGADTLITIVRHGGAGATQLFAIGISAAVIGLVLATVKSALPQYLRASSVFVGMMMLLAVSLSAVQVTLPRLMTLVVAGTAALLVLGAVAAAARIFTLRGAALVLGGVAASGLLRIVSVLCASQTEEVVSERWAMAARAGATLSFAIDAASTILAVVLLVTQPSARALHQPAGSATVGRRWVALAVVLVLPALFAVGSLVGADLDQNGLPVLLKNMADHLRILPEPYAPDVVRIYLEALRWVTAGAFVVLVPRSRMLAAAVALALFTRATLEVPLCAAALVVAALTLGVHPGPDLRRDVVPRG